MVRERALEICFFGERGRAQCFMVRGAVARGDDGWCLGFWIFV